MNKSKSLRYQFEYVTHCNMCNSEIETHTILGKRLNQSQGKSPKNKLGFTTTICKCNNCSLIYCNPLPIPYDLQDHYGIPAEDYWNEHYFKISKDYFQHEFEQLKKLIDFKIGMKSLDIGTGIGKQMIALSNFGFDSYGFEASNSFYEMAISKMKISEDKLKLGTIESIEYPENQFDFISFGAVLEHLYNPSESIIKALKWLKPNGVIHIEVPSADWFINKIINAYYKINLTDYVGNLSPMHEPFHLHEFSLKSFELHGKLNDYRVASHVIAVCPTYMPRFLDFILKPYMKMTNTGMQLTVWLRKK